MQYEIKNENVKFFGRTLLNRGVLWCALSGTGIGFSFYGKKAVLHLVGDDSTFGNETEGQARVGILVNGERAFDFIMKEKEKSLTVWESKTEQEVTIQVIKLSEAAMSTIGIKGVEVDAVDGIRPLPEKLRKIEFIGDSITCGFGIDKEEPESAFLTETEDVTKAYAYRVAQKLSADYSMVSYSGYGVISGYTDTDEKEEKQLVPHYYERVGFSYAHPFGDVVLEQFFWDFRKFQPHAVVVNLGTNDDSYCKDNETRQKEFTNQYEKFLKVVRAHNPQAQIFCTVGVMGDRIYPALLEAVTEYCRQNEDENVHVFCLEVQKPEDGLVSCSHPTVITHEKVATKVASEIKRVMGW